MEQGSKVAVILCVLLIAAVFQILFIVADDPDSPGHAALEFTEAYYWLNPDMAERVCSDLLQSEDGNPVTDYLAHVEKEARELGYATTYMRYKLYGTKIHTISKDESSAEVRVSAQLRRAPNLPFVWVARLFLLGETHPLEKTLRLTREEGRWKVCEGAFPLSV